jgi:hypothetical protein
MAQRMDQRMDPKYMLTFPLGCVIVLAGFWQEGQGFLPEKCQLINGFLQNTYIKMARR